MKIDVFCNDGSPLGLVPTDMYGVQGMGGAELSLFSWAEAMAAIGHTVRIYNDPRIEMSWRGFDVVSRRRFDPSQSRDVFIAFRSPTKFLPIVRAEKRIHWSTDQYTTGNFTTDIIPYVDNIVCISPFHVEYYKNRYGNPENIGYIDLGVREDYGDVVEKVKNRCIYCSVPGRGLDVLAQMWGAITSAVPDASLVITSDYTLWGSLSPNNATSRRLFSEFDNVQFLGKVPRARMVKEQQRAEFHPYPCVYDELFCISAAETQVAGTIPITSDAGALKTTNQYGTIIPGNPYDINWKQAFVGEVVGQMTGKNRNDGHAISTLARARFDWAWIAKAWERLLETGEYPDIQ